jgi:hypothetical protein
MPRQNRVTPLGDLIATDARGLVYGNRGCLHDADGRIRRRYQVKRWIACRLVFRDWHRSPLLQPGKFTELFFLDEATALAAGHRPCALCRHEDYTRFAALWRDLHGDVGADAIDGGSTTSGSTPSLVHGACTASRWTTYPTAPSCCRTERRTLSSARGFCRGRHRGTRRRSRARPESRRHSSRRRRSSRCFPAGAPRCPCSTRPRGRSSRRALLRRPDAACACRPGGRRRPARRAPSGRPGPPRSRRASRSCRARCAAASSAAARRAGR